MVVVAKEEVQRQSHTWLLRLPAYASIAPCRIWIHMIFWFNFFDTFLFILWDILLYTLEKGFLIPSIFADLEKRFNELKSVGIFTEENLKEFLKKTRPELRLNNYEVFFGKKMHLDDRKGLVMKLIYIERYLATKFMLALPQKAFAKINKDKEVKQELMKMSGSMKSMFLQPWEVVDGQYGVPSTHEMDELYPAFVTQRKYALDGSLEAQMDNLNNLLKKETFTQELRDLESIKKIKK